MDFVYEILLKSVGTEIADNITKEFKEFYNLRTQSEKVLFYFKHQAICSNVEIQEVFENIIPQTNVMTHRLCQQGYLTEYGRDNKVLSYNITDEGTNIVNKKITMFLDRCYLYQEYIRSKRKTSIEGKLSDDREIVKKFTNAFIELNLQLSDDNKIIIDLKKLAEFDYELVEYIYSNVKESMKIIIVYFKDQYPLIKSLNVYDIKFLNAHTSEFNPISRINREYKGMIFTKGLITSKKEMIKSKIMLIEYLCTNSSCRYAQESIKTDLVGLKTCPMCKSPVEIMKEYKINMLETKITDVDSGISFPIYVHGDIASEFSYLGLGDEIEVVGHLEPKMVEIGGKEPKNNQVIEMVIVISSFSKTDYVHELCKEDNHEVELILSRYKEPKEFLMIPFDDYIENDKIKELFLLQQMTKHDEILREAPVNIAMMGEPGIGKNELIKICEEYFPNCDTVAGADITDAGFKGTVNRETGIKEIGLAKKCQNGTIFFNEFDKFVKSNMNGKKGASQLLNTSITEQEIRLNKAGIRMRMKNLDLRHNIFFNPLDEKIIETKSLYDQMSAILDKSLLSRMLPVYIGKDNARSKKVFQLMLQNKKRNTDFNVHIYKLVIKYLRAKPIFITAKAEEHLTKIFNNLLERDVYGVISIERIGKMLIQLSKAICRLRNHNECLPSHIKEAYDIYLHCLKTVGITLENLEQLNLEESVEDMKKIKTIKEYISNHIAVANKLGYSNLVEAFPSVSDELRMKGWTAVLGNDEYTEYYDRDKNRYIKLNKH
jgi:DNA replicative helicase MCM subunit Mcm2 (Cdc46/Mcm family)